jgi:hypothetical protein
VLHPVMSGDGRGRLTDRFGLGPLVDLVAA